MEERLNEILEDAEERILQYEREREELNYKIRFLQDHGFEKEKDWVVNKCKALSSVFFCYRETVQNIRELLNKWAS
jgi:hypothetical protein